MLDNWTAIRHIKSVLRWFIDSTIDLSWSWCYNEGMERPLDNPMHSTRIDDERDHEQEYNDELEQADRDYDAMVEDWLLDRD